MYAHFLNTCTQLTLFHLEISRQCRSPHTMRALVMSSHLIGLVVDVCLQVCKNRLSTKQVSVVAKSHAHNNTTTQQHNKHNNNQKSHQDSLPSAVLPYFVMGRSAAPPNHGSVAPKYPRKASGTGFVLGLVGAPVWGVEQTPIEKQRDERGVGLRWLRLSRKQATIIQQLTAAKEGFFQTRRGRVALCGGASYHQIGQQFEGGKRINKYTVGLDDCQLTQLTQPPPKIDRHGEGNIGEEV